LAAACGEAHWHPLAWGALAPPVDTARQGIRLQIHYHNRKTVHAKIREESGADLLTAWISCWREWMIISLIARTTPATYHLLSSRRLK